MRFGGGEISLTDDFGSGSETRTFRSAYFAIDITDPLNPNVLWEYTDANLGFTTSYPAIAYTHQTNKECWVTFGSGPTDYDGTSSQLGRTYVVDLLTGQPPAGGSPIATNWGSGNNSFMGDPSSVDIDIVSSQCSGGTCSYEPDVFYIGDSLGTLWRISCIGGTWAGNQSVLLSLGSTKPIVAGPSIAQDDDGRQWIYFGTGKLFAESDQLNTDAQSLVGVKEPLDWSDCDTDSVTNEMTIYCSSCLGGTTVSSANLLNTTDYSVFQGGSVDTDDDLTNGTESTFTAVENDIIQDNASDPSYDGWIINMTGGERCITKSTVLGGLVTFSTYLPDVADICKHEGDSYLSAIYYKTGTASYESVIGTDDTVTIVEGGETKEKIKRRTSLGYGVASSPSLHVGKRKGAKVIIQTSTGEIVEVDQESLPGAYKSRPLHWLETQN
jgi:type IV pilus assembly protein PilY1